MQQMKMQYDVIVVGAGHAGCEAATAAARMGAETLLVTMDMNKVAQMSCNPAVGGIAKGQIVREIDALGGQMGLVTDACSIQFRMLNISKGPAVWSPRAQCDRGKYIWQWRSVLENTPHLHIWQDQAMELLVQHGMATGIRTLMGVEIGARCVVVCAGTFLNGLMHIGRVQIAGGRVAEPTSTHFSESIAAHGINMARMKTGTPVRIDGRTVHFDEMERQDGDDTSSAPHRQFSYIGPSRPLPQLPCWMTYTNPQVHERLLQALPDSPLYNGTIKSIGPRYCPSIETKLVTFADREQHLLFLEPEGTNTQEFYLNGFSSSLPIDAQIEALRLIPAFRDLEVYRPGYAIEYDFFDPTQLRHTLESRVIDGLFLAGQVNGTTGYEEAAGQGLIAGINAAMKCSGSGSFTLARDQAYIGVLIDDLVTKGVDEPYRMFTSRAEYRILLRQDDADQRLTPLAHSIGMASDERMTALRSKQAAIAAITSWLRDTSITPADVNATLQALGTAPIEHSVKLLSLVERPGVTIDAIRQIVASEPHSAEAFEAAEIAIKYAGYIRREREQADKMRRLEEIHIRGHFDYNSINALSTEARQKLTRQDPETLGQASRIPGVSPSDVQVLLVLMGR